MTIFGMLGWLVLRNTFNDSAVVDHRLAQKLDRGRVEAISLIMLGRGAGGEIAVALTLVVAQGADALHVAQHQRLGAREIGLVDTEGLEQLRQFIRGMRSLTDQLLSLIHI